MAEGGTGRTIGGHGGLTVHVGTPGECAPRSYWLHTPHLPPHPKSTPSLKCSACFLSPEAFEAVFVLIRVFFYFQVFQVTFVSQPG